VELLFMLAGTWIEVSNVLDEPAIRCTARIRDNDPEKGLFLGAPSSQAYGHHGVSFLSQTTKA
jgi:hypothetical protein